MAFYDNFQQFGEKIACIDSAGNSLDYQTLNTLSGSLGAQLKPRSLVVLLCENSIGSILGYVSFLRQGSVPILLDKNMEKDLRSALIERYRPNYLYVPADLSGQIKEEYPEAECVWTDWQYDLYFLNAEPHTLYPDLALLLTTSGSTGSPKLVRQSYRNIQANAASIAEYLKITADDRPITTLPMNYTYGLSIINSHLLTGATILVTDHTLMQREFWNFFKTEQATTFGGVPYTYEILKKLRFFRMDLPSLRYMTQAGGKLSKELHKEFAEYAKEQGKQFIIMYGQCEATARMSYLPAEYAIEKCGSMGIAIPGGRFEIIDGEGQVITEPEVDGELVYYGENVTLGYAECIEDLQKSDERFGRLETGDIAKRDVDGFYYIVGRKKRFLKIFGNRVNLDEIEAFVKKQITQGECACGGVDDKLYVFLTEFTETLQTDIKKLLAEKTGLNPSAFTVKAIDEIPKNEAGKTLYKELEHYL